MKSGKESSRLSSCAGLPANRRVVKASTWKTLVRMGMVTYLGGLRLRKYHADIGKARSDCIASVTP
jgi:hypothetical protein